jgi:hypothetical protein
MSEGGNWLSPNSLPWQGSGIQMFTAFHCHLEAPADPSLDHSRQSVASTRHGDGDRRPATGEATSGKVGFVGADEGRNTPNVVIS